MNEKPNDKLSVIINEIEDSFKAMKELEVQSNAQLLIHHAKVIEKGEKKLNKELVKRKNKMSALIREIKTINELGERIGYTNTQQKENE